MVQRNIRFMTTGQLMTFCNVCQKMNADITVKDVTGRFEIDAKSIVGLMTIRMGEKMHLLIEGEEEHLADWICRRYTEQGAGRWKLPMIITVFFIMRQSIKVSHRRRQS